MSATLIKCHYLEQTSSLAKYVSTGNNCYTLKLALFDGYILIFGFKRKVLPNYNIQMICKH